MVIEFQIEFALGLAAAWVGARGNPWRWSPFFILIRELVTWCVHTEKFTVLYT